MRESCSRVYIMGDELAVVQWTDGNWKIILFSRGRWDDWGKWGVVVGWVRGMVVCGAVGGGGGVFGWWVTPLHWVRWVVAVCRIRPNEDLFPVTFPKDTGNIPTRCYIRDDGGL